MLAVPVLVILAGVPLVASLHPELPLVRIEDPLDAPLRFIVHDVEHVFARELHFGVDLTHAIDVVILLLHRDDVFGHLEQHLLIDRLDDSEALTLVIVVKHVLEVRGKHRWKTGHGQG